MAIARPTGPRTEMSWRGWGDPTQAAPLPEPLRRLLHDALGVREGHSTPPAPAGAARARAA